MNNMRPPAAAPPTAAAARTVYEDFKPLSEWKQEHGAHLLLIHLPGFMRDHIRVTSEPFNIIKVRGQRLLPPTTTNNINKWTRFNQDYAVPQDCTIRGIRAKLDAGILTITMPNKIILDPPPKPTAVTPKKESPDLPSPQKLINKTTVENPPTPKKESPHPKLIDEINKTTVENTPTPKNFIDDIKKKIMDATSPSPPKVEDKASTEAPKPPTSLEDRMKNIVHMPNDNKAEADQPKKDQKSGAEKEKEKDKEEVSPAAELKTKLLDYEEEEESKKKDSTGEKTNASEADKFNKMVQGLTLRIKEDRESLVNVGVAVLILLALGIYVTQ